MRPYFMRDEKSTVEPKKISLQNLIGAFWLLLGGHLIALAVLISEIFFFTANRNCMLSFHIVNKKV